MTKTRLSKEDWLAAGFRALTEHGPAGLQINLLCKALGTTKGSFYWHFKDLAAYKSEMLTLWQSKVATEIIASVEAAPTAQARLDMLLSEAARPAPEAFGGRRIEASMRAWALSDAAVSAQLACIDAARLAALRQVLTDAGHGTPGLAELVYGTYIGLDDLTARGRGRLEPALDALRGLLSRS